MDGLRTDTTRFGLRNESEMFVQRSNSEGTRPSRDEWQPRSNDLPAKCRTKSKLANETKCQTHPKLAKETWTRPRLSNPRPIESLCIDAPNSSSSTARPKGLSKPPRRTKAAA